MLYTQSGCHSCMTSCFFFCPPACATGNPSESSVRFLANYTSSLKCNTRQPQFEKLVHLIEPNDTLIVTKLDRFARNTREALNLIDDLLEEKIMIKVLNLGTIDNTPIGRMIVRTLLSVAEMERDMIIERTQAGKIFARQHNPNYKEGRPKRKKDSRNMAIFEYSNSHTVKEAAEAFNISPRTV